MVAADSTSCLTTVITESVTSFASWARSTRSCTTICAGVDGCVGAVKIYDPLIYPCGTDIPSLKEDLPAELCTAASAGILGATLAGLALTRRR